MALKNKKIREEITKRGKFTIIPNELWESKVSSYARIVWCYLVSKQEGWDMSRNNLSRNLNIGRDKISEAIKELTDTGMITVESKPGLPLAIEVNWCDAWNFKDTAAVDVGQLEDTNDGTYEPDVITPGRTLRPARASLEASLDVPDAYTKEEEGRKDEDKFFLDKEQSLEKRKERPTVDQIRRSWERSSLPENILPAQSDRLPFLRDLMATLRDHGYAESDLPRSFPEATTSHWWSKAKKKDQREQMRSQSLSEYDRALADLADPVEISHAAHVEIRKNVPKKTKDALKDDKPIGMSVETCIRFMELTEDNDAEADELFEKYHVETEEEKAANIRLQEIIALGRARSKK